MAKSKATLEKELKRLLIRTHQEIFGKGPEEVWVKVNRHVGTFYCSKTLTHLEEYLLGMPDGEEEVIRLRQNIFKHIKRRLCSEIEAISGVKVLRLTGDLCVRSKTLFGAILFQDDLDEMFS